MNALSRPYWLAFTVITDYELGAYLLMHPRVIKANYNIIMDDREGSRRQGIEVYGIMDIYFFTQMVEKGHNHIYGNLQIDVLVTGN